MGRKKTQKAVDPVILQRQGDAAIQEAIEETLDHPVAATVSAAIADANAGIPLALQAQDLDAHRTARGHILIRELAARRMEGLRLYEPLPEQQAFHESKAQLRIARGSNRSGKTICAAAEVARAVTGSDPHGKYPLKNGVCVCIGKDFSHVGGVIWKKLGRADPFKMIRDRNTGLWRARRPWEPADAARKQDARPALPLIPHRMIESIAWYNKKESIPAMVTLTNGWEIRFYSSLGAPPNGITADLFWFDEEIIHPMWYVEMVARILDTSGRGIWSATPQAGTEQLFELHERADRERRELEKKDRSCEEFIILLADNPHITEEDKKAFAANLSEEDARVRILGEFLITSFKMYPEFSMTLHGMEIEEIPSHWTCYAYIDPGHVTCAVLFCAVPPPEEGKFVLLYDELYIKQCNARMFAEAMANKCQGRNMQAFIIDAHTAVHTEMGIGLNVMQQYSQELSALKVKAIQTGCSFLLTSGDINSGVTAVHSMLRIRDDGTPYLRVRRGFLPHFEWEIKRYYKARVKGEIIDKPDQKKDNHLMDAARYAAMHNPQFVKRKAQKPAPGYAVQAMKKKSEKRRKQDGGAVLNLGPSRRQ